MPGGWPFRKKAKNDHEAGGSGKGKKPRNKRYVSVEFGHRLWRENRPVPWPDASLPGGGWYMSSRRVPIPPVPESGRERRLEIERRRFILPPDLRADPAFARTSRNWTTFGTWEFDPRRRAGYLGDVDFFNNELRGSEDEEETDHDDDPEYEEEEADDDAEYEEEDAAEEEDDAEEEDEAEVDDGGAHVDVPVWGPETQPLDISEEQAVAIAVANSELDQLGMWEGLAVQLRESSLAQGRPATPPATPTRSQGAAPAMEWDAWPQSPQPPPPSPWSPWPAAPMSPLPPPPPVYAVQWRPEIIYISDDE